MDFCLGMQRYARISRDGAAFQSSCGRKDVAWRLSWCCGRLALRQQKASQLILWSCHPLQLYAKAGVGISIRQHARERGIRGCDLDRNIGD